MPKASTFGLRTATQMIDSDTFPMLTNAGENVRLPVSEARSLVGPGWSSTVNAYNEVGVTREIKIQAAISRAISIGADRVFVPTSMHPYDASLITFDNDVQMVREGGSFDLYDVQAYGAAGDNAQDDTIAIQAAIDAGIAKGAGGQTVFFPPGTYKTTANLVASIPQANEGGVELKGIPFGSIIRPTVAVSICLTLANDITITGTNNRLFVQGLRFEGVDTAGATGILVGENVAHISGYVTIRDVEIYRFGSGGIGMDVRDQVVGLYENLYIGLCSTNLHIGGSTGQPLPTVQTFHAVHVRVATGKGIVIDKGNRIDFAHCNIESNTQEGVYVVPTTAVDVLNLNFTDCWFENNYNASSTDYQVRADGTSAATVSIFLRNINFSGLARGLYYKNVSTFVLDNVTPVNAANQLFIDTVCQGAILSHAENNAPLATVLTNNSGGNVDMLGPKMHNKVWFDGNDNLSPTAGSTYGLGDTTFRWRSVFALRYAGWYDQPTYGTTVTPNALMGNLCQILATDGVAFTVAAPTNPANIQWLTIQVKNSSGGALGAITWNAAYHMAAFTAPATGFSRGITFFYTGGYWEEVSRTPADVPN